MVAKLGVEESVLNEALAFVRATEADLPIFESLARDAMTTFYEVHGMEWRPDLFLEGFLVTENFRIELHKATVGVLRISQESDHVYVFDLHVAPDARNQGVGSQALKFVESLAESANKSSIKMSAFKSNPAINLYLRLGFQVVAEDEKFVRVRKMLSQPIPHP